MLISDTLDCDAAAKELAGRFWYHRVSSGITQKELAEKTGVGLRTIGRFENGEEIGLFIFVKLLQGIGLEHNLENMIPDYAKRPSYFTEGNQLPKRARKKKAAKRGGKWGDEK